MAGFLSTFLSQHSTQDAIAKARKATVAARRVRRSSLHMVRAIDHVLQFLGQSLHRFVPTYDCPKPLNRVESRYKAPCTQFPYEVPENVPKLRYAIKNSSIGLKRWEVGPLSDPRKCLVLSSDRCGVNLAAASFLKHVVGTRVFFCRTHTTTLGMTCKRLANWQACGMQLQTQLIA